MHHIACLDAHQSEAQTHSGVRLYTNQCNALPIPAPPCIYLELWHAQPSQSSTDSDDQSHGSRKLCGLLSKLSRTENHSPLGLRQTRLVISQMLFCQCAPLGKNLHNHLHL